MNAIGDDPHSAEVAAFDPEDFHSNQLARGGPFVDCSQFAHESYKMAKTVTFCDCVDVIAHTYEDTTNVQVPLDWSKPWLRSFWTMEGQNATWEGVSAAFERVEHGSSPWTQSCSLEDDEIVVSIASDASTSQVSQPFFPTQQSSAIHSNEQNRLETLLNALVRHPKPRYLSTWYVANGRHHVCTESRQIRIAEGWTLHSFRQACRDLWVDLMSQDDFAWFHVMEETPPESNAANVIIAQGIDPDQMVSLLQYDGYPILRKRRALLFNNGRPAAHVLQAAALFEVCNRDRIKCQVEFEQPWQRTVVTEHEILQVPVPTVLKAQAMVLNDSDDENDVDHDENQESDEEDRSTAVPSCTDGLDEISNTELENDIDHFSLMSLPNNGQCFQPLPPPQVWEPPMVNLVNDAPDDMEEDATIGVVEDQWDELVAYHAEVVTASEDQTFTVVTFGLGLVSLGRRDAAVQSDDIEVMLGAIADLWEDHAQLAPLRVILIRPQPVLDLGRRYVAFIVEVQYVPETDPLRRRAILIQETGDPEVVAQICLYPAWTGHRGNSNALLSSIQRDDVVYPHTVRQVTVHRADQLMDSDRWVEFNDGDLCTVHFENFPRHVTQAAAQVACSRAVLGSSIY